MGLLGMVITVAIMVIGGGYLLFGPSHGHFVAENPTISQQSTDNSQQRAVNNQQESPAGELAQGMAALDAAKKISQQSTESSQQLADSIDQGAVNSQQLTSNTQQDSQPALPARPTGGENQKSLPVRQAGEIAVKDRLVSFGYAVPKSPRTIDTVVIHSSYNSTGGDPYSVDKVIGIWKSYGVAPHYMIDRAGTVYRLVADTNIAYHAGAAKMPDGRTNVNDFSIGIEMLNTMTGKYTDAQYTAVNALIATLKGEYPIKSVVGHSDIAPGRKTDPWNFDWKRLE